MTTEPTCSAAGVKTFTCALCNATRTEEVAIDPEAHAWNDGEVTTEPTCSAKGVKTFTCALCNATRTEEVAIDPEAHDWNEGEVTTEATCTEEGVFTYTCKNCGKTRTEAIPAIGHSFEGYVSNGDGTHQRACLNGCGEIMVDNCDYQPTAMNGMDVEICFMCGSVKLAPAVVATLEKAVQSEKLAKPVENAQLMDAPADLTVTVVNIDFSQNDADILRLFTVSLAANGEKTVLETPVRISIPVSEQMVELLSGQGMTLFRLLESGEIVEIPYEIIEGKLVFEIDQGGVFFFQPVEAE